jgi:hypothetical protein
LTGISPIPRAAPATAGGLNGRSFRLFWGSVAQQSVRQALTPTALMGRTMAATWTLVFAAATAGAIASTRVAARIGAAHALCLLGGSLAALVVVGTFTPAAAAHPEREHATE